MRLACPRFVGGAALFAILAWHSDAFATTYKVGPNEEFKDLSAVEEILEPGDVVEVAGDATYPGNIHIRQDSAGTTDARVTIRGVRVNGKRPRLEGGAEFTIVLNADHIVFEGFEVTGGADYCVVHKADDVTIRDVVVHGCPQHGILGTDDEAGDLLMEFVEVYDCGDGDHRHQVYIATDEGMFPGSTFRLQNSFIHDQNGGNSVKSRAERNEIYGNWIESSVAGYHNLDLIGPDGEPTGTAREDSDVVGNVLVQKGEWSFGRLGGDGTGETRGRYRFAFNTMIASPEVETLFRITDGIESLEISNNVMFLPNGGEPTMVNDELASWVSAFNVSGTSNFVHSGVLMTDFLQGTVVGDDPGFVNASMNDFRIKETSPLVDKALATGLPPAGSEIPNPGMPTVVPPAYQVDPSLTALPRPLVGDLDIGAFEFGTGTDPGMTTNATSSGVGGAGGEGGAGGSGGGSNDSGCSCGVAGGVKDGTWLATLIVAIAIGRRRSGANDKRRA
jgi:hypothetical protein